MQTLCPRKTDPDWGMTCCQACVVFSKRLRDWRAREKLSLREVAEGLGVSISTVSAWEQGTRFPSGAHLNVLAHYLQTPICTLLYDGDGNCPYGTSGEGGVTHTGQPA